MKHPEEYDAIHELRLWRARGPGTSCVLRDWEIRSTAHAAVIVTIRWVDKSGAERSIRKSGDAIAGPAAECLREFASSWSDDAFPATLPGHTHELGEAGA